MVFVEANVTLFCESKLLGGDGSVLSLLKLSSLYNFGIGIGSVVADISAKILLAQTPDF
jgi:hypothetical protein